jgi:hypothetical protein
MTTWRKRDPRQHERTAQHDIADGRIISQPNVHVQALRQFFTAYEFDRLNRGWLPESVGPNEQDGAPCKYAFMSSAMNAGTWFGVSLSAGRPSG